MTVRQPTLRSQRHAAVRLGQPTNGEPSSATSVMSTVNQNDEERPEAMTPFTGGDPGQIQSIGTTYVFGDKKPINIISPSTDIRQEIGNHHHSDFVPIRRRAASFGVTDNNITAVYCPWFCPYSSRLKSPPLLRPVSQVAATSRGKEILTFFPAFTSPSPLSPLAWSSYTANQVMLPPKLFRYTRLPVSTLANVHHVTSAFPTTPYLVNAVTQTRGGYGVWGAAEGARTDSETVCEKQSECTSVVSADSSSCDSRDSHSPINVCD